MLVSVRVDSPHPGKLARAFFGANGHFDYAYEAAAKKRFVRLVGFALILMSLRLNSFVLLTVRA